MIRNNFWKEYLNSLSFDQSLKNTANQLHKMVENFQDVSWGRNANDGLSIAAAKNKESEKYVLLILSRNGSSWAEFRNKNNCEKVLVVTCFKTLKKQIEEYIS